MKLVQDVDAIRSLQLGQRGVFSKGDLQRIFTERHPAAFSRRVKALIEYGALKRFIRGWYITKEADLSVLSQRIAPESYISMDTVLSSALLVGVSPDLGVTAIKIGRSRVYEGCGLRIVHLGIKPSLFFGFTGDGPVRRALPEKAVLDVLYFYLRGRNYPFDIFADIDFSKLDSTRFAEYLKAYRNPKFVTFVKGVVDS